MRDLFGVVPVSQREVDLWLSKVPGLPCDSPRRASYARQYNVVEKIRRAKLEGWWFEAVPDETCPFCGLILAPEKETPAL